LRLAQNIDYPSVNNDGTTQTAAEHAGQNLLKLYNEIQWVSLETLSTPKINRDHRD